MIRFSTLKIGANIKNCCQGFCEKIKKNQAGHSINPVKYRGALFGSLKVSQFQICNMLLKTLEQVACCVKVEKKNDIDVSETCQSFKISDFFVLPQLSDFVVSVSKFQNICSRTVNNMRF